MARSQDQKRQNDDTWRGYGVGYTLTIAQVTFANLQQETCQLRICGTYY